MVSIGDLQYILTSYVRVGHKGGPELLGLCLLVRNEGECPTPSKSSELHGFRGPITHKVDSTFRKRMERIKGPNLAKSVDQH